jgi:hypothetical protein
MRWATKRRVGYVLVALLAACAQGTANQEGPDARVVDFPDADPAAPDASTPGTPDAGPGTPMMRTLSQTTADTIVAANSVSCNGETSHSENHYYRVFDLAAAGINGAFQVSQVTVGIESASSGTGTQPATIVLHTLTGAPALANLTQLTSSPVTIADQGAGVRDFAVSATAPAGSKLVVEFTTPDGTAGTNLLFIGSNAAGETAPSYITAPLPAPGGCDITELTTTGALGFPTMHVVMKVTGTYTP